MHALTLDPHLGGGRGRSKGVESRNKEQPDTNLKKKLGGGRGLSKEVDSRYREQPDAKKKKVKKCMVDTKNSLTQILKVSALAYLLCKMPLYV
jgi:hypothetical protein